MSGRGRTWRLCRGDEPLGEITIKDAGSPWLTGTFVAAPGFADVTSLFERELTLMESEAWEEWEAVYGHIAETLSLVGRNGPAAEFLLHIKGDEAWFRWSDEPFDDA